MSKAGTMKIVPNCLSLIRILLSLVLLFVKPLSTGFYILYVTCGVTDILDGFIARKTGTASRLGARLDTLADIIMTGVLFVKLLPVLRLPYAILVWILVIGMVRLVSILVARIKYNTFAMLHTYGNKATGLLLFLIPIFLSDNISTLWIYFIGFIASVSALEELAIHLTSKELRLNRKSILEPRN
ncbi:MAG: phosphatidylglycerophosphate synthase [Eubacterium sp.]|jgi:CDP-diacylglycerol--glycerol-3-phosphate 3-phosphatidyltransferase|nr:phosphatidylglycerophosphate synthase [Eubacterium sp.]